MCLQAIQISSFVKCSNILPIFFMLCFESSLHILHTSLLYGKCFLPICGFSFHLLTRGRGEHAMTEEPMEGECDWRMEHRESACSEAMETAGNLQTTLKNLAFILRG